MTPDDIRQAIKSCQEEAARYKEELPRREAEVIRLMAAEKLRVLNARVDAFLREHLETVVYSSVVKDESCPMLYMGRDEEFAQALCKKLVDAGVRATVKKLGPHQGGSDSPYAPIGYGRGDDNIPEYRVYLDLKP